MLFLTNCLTKVADEGCVKLATSIVRRIKRISPEATVVSYDRYSDFADENIEVNKFFLSKNLKAFANENVILIPFPARPWATALRIFNLSRHTKKHLNVIMTMTTDADFLTRFLLKKSKANFTVFSRDAEKFYADIVGADRVKYIKTGVDTKKFVPVSEEKTKELKIKYGFNPDKKLILHVGHLNRGRNIEHLKKISKEFSVLLVTSTLTKDEQDIELKNELSACENIKIIDDFIPDIQEVYQMSDVYFFPVVESGRCIDVPLSCMEAAACNKPIVTTPFGEMKEFIGKEGFYFIENFDAENLNSIIEKALERTDKNTRKNILEYDWENAVSYFRKIGE